MTEFLNYLAIALIFGLFLLTSFLLATTRRRPWRHNPNDSGPDDQAYIKRDAWNHPDDM